MNSIKNMGSGVMADGSNYIHQGLAQSDPIAAQLATQGADAYSQAMPIAQMNLQRLSNQGLDDYTKGKQKYTQTDDRARAAAMQDFGASGQDLLNKQKQEGARQGAALASAQGKQAGATAAGATRGAGMSRTAAARAGANAAGQASAQGYNSGFQQGMGNYLNSANAYQNQASNEAARAFGQQNLGVQEQQSALNGGLGAANMGMQGQNAAAGLYQNKAQLGAGMQANGMSALQNAAANMEDPWDLQMRRFAQIGQMAGGIASAVSDEDAKDKHDNAYDNDIVGEDDDSGGMGDELSGITDMAGSIGSMFSDKKSKGLWDDIGEDSPLFKFAQKVKGYTYNYKPGMEDMTGEDPNKEHWGPMAQDLLETPLADTVIQDDPSGLLKVDTSRLALGTAGLTAEAGKRIASLEQEVQELKQALKGRK